MTPSDPALEERLRDWLVDGPDALPDRSARAIMHAVAAIPQESPRWWHRLMAAAPALALGGTVAAAGAVVAIVGVWMLDRDAPSAGGQRADVIAYASNVDGTLDIWTVDLASGQSTQLTSGPESETTPDWSPDGRRLAFIRDGDLWTMAADGSEQESIVVGDGTVEGVDWSPDGTTIAYGYQRDDGQSEIRAVAGDGSNDRMLLAVDAPFGCCPSWSPTGDELVIAIDLSTSGGQIDLYLLSADGGSPRRLTFADGDDGSPAWSPVGDLIAFQSDAAGGLALIAPDGSGRSGLVRVSTRGFTSAWSPTGDRIAWVDPGGELRVMDLADPSSSVPIPIVGIPDRHSLSWRDD
jgi:Tol biopolymer transport system component